MSPLTRLMKWISELPPYLRRDLIITVHACAPLGWFRDLDRNRRDDDDDGVFTDFFTSVVASQNELPFREIGMVLFLSHLIDLFFLEWSQDDQTVEKLLRACRSQKIPRSKRKEVEEQFAGHPLKQRRRHAAEDSWHKLKEEHLSLQALKQWERHEQYYTDTFMAFVEFATRGNSSDE